MSKVCVVTGGGSGMGLSAAKFMPKDRIIVVSGRTESKLTKAVEQLREAGFEAYAKACDTSKRDSVKAICYGLNYKRVFFVFLILYPPVQQITQTLKNQQQAPLAILP